MGIDILTEIRAAGITLSLDGGNLVATPKAALTDELRTLIRAHKAELLEALAAPAVTEEAPRAPVNLDEAVRTACEDGAGTPEGDGPEHQPAEPTAEEGGAGDGWDICVFCNGNGCLNMVAGWNREAP